MNDAPDISNDRGTPRHLVGTLDSIDSLLVLDEPKEPAIRVDERSYF